MIFCGKTDFTKKDQEKTRPDTQLPQPYAGGQGLYLRSVEYLARSSKAEIPINAEKVKCDGRTNGPTKRGEESRSTRLKTTILIRFWC